MAARLAEALERDGFALVPEVLGPREVSGLIEAIGHADAAAGASRRAGGVYAMRDLLRAVPEVRRLADSAAIRDLVMPIVGPGAFAVRGLLFDKTPGANWGVPWHRDLTIAVRRRVDVPGFGPWTVKAGVPHVRPPAEVLRRMLAVRLHLDDCGMDNGPLRVVPGSHADPDPVDEAASALVPGASSPAISCPIGAGGALLMRPLLRHASSSSAAPGHRRVVHLEFAAGPLPGGLDWFESSATANARGDGPGMPKGA